MKVPTESPGNRGYDVVTITTTWRMSGAARPAEHETPRHDQGFDQHAGGQLRLADPALDEDDGDFTHPEFPELRLVQHFGEEGVAVGHHAGDRELRERLAPPAAEAARAVARREARHEANVAVRERAQEDARERPVHHADAAGSVAGADDGIVVRARAHQIRQVLGPVRQIAVHLADEVRGALVQRVRQAVHVGASEPARSGTVHHLDASRVLLDEAVGNRARPVGRAVVHDEQAEARVLQHARREQREVILFVIGRRDYENVHRSCVRSLQIRAAVTISAGSITGRRNRSCGKKMSPARIVDAAISHNGSRACVAYAPRAPRTPATAAARTSPYEITEAAKYRDECTAYEGPIGTMV